MCTNNITKVMVKFDTQLKFMFEILVYLFADENFFIKNGSS